MKRICLTGAAVAALFIIGATNTTALGSSATAAKAAVRSQSKAKSTPGPIKFSCAVAFILQAPSNASTVTEGAASGDHAGVVACPLKVLGKGAERDAFTTDAGGNLVGKWQEWFKGGSVYGTYSLAADDSKPPTSTSFSAASYTGRFVIKNGTGNAGKATGKGTIKCATPDSVHYFCKESGRLVLPSSTATQKR